jgi:hypothetical protein
MAGVLSGWRGTAWIDTTINEAQVEVALELYMEQGFANPLELLIAQGDDDEIRLKTKHAANFILNVYNQAGFEVNPNKMYISTVRDDFLRKTITYDKVSGPPARAVNAIIWADPSSRDYERGMDRIHSTVNSWAMLSGRGCNTKATYHMMVEDLVNLTKYPRAVVEGLLRTPKTLGGLGWHKISLGEGYSLKFDLVKEQELKIPTPEYISQFWHESVQFEAEEVGNWHMIFNNLVSSISKVEIVPRVWMRMTEPISLGPQWNDEVPLFGLKKVIAKEYKRNRDWVYSIVKDKATFLYVEARCRRSVFLNWLEADLDFKTPVVARYGPEMMTVISKDVFERVWGGLLSRGRVNRKALENGRLFGEWEVRNRLYKYERIHNWHIAP